MASAWINRIILLLSFMGVFIAGVLSYSHAAHVLVPCGAGHGCAQVAASPWSSIGPIPVAYLGFVTYLGLVILSLWRGQQEEAMWRKGLILGWILSGFGVLFSMYLTLVSLVAIQATCQWCLSSLGVMVAIFIGHGLLGSRGYEAKSEIGKDGMLAAAGLIVALGLTGFNISLMKDAGSEVLKNVNANVENKEILPPPSRIRGNADGKVTLVEIADFNCPACRTAAPKVKKLFEKYQGKLKWAYRNFPLYMVPGHESSITACRMSLLAASKGKFWDFADIVFDPSNTERLKDDSGILAMAVEAGIDKASAGEIFKEGNTFGFDELADETTLISQKLRITGTPTFMLLAEGIKPKPVTFENIQSALDSEPYASLLR